MFSIKNLKLSDYKFRPERTSIAKYSKYIDGKSKL